MKFTFLGTRKHTCGKNVYLIKMCVILLHTHVKLRSAFMAAGMSVNRNISLEMVRALYIGL